MIIHFTGKYMTRDTNSIVHSILSDTLRVIFLFVVYAKGDFQRLVISSLVDNTGLPRNPPIDPFYDSITSALPGTRRQRSTKYLSKLTIPSC